ETPMPDLEPDLAALTTALGGLSPATSLNRDRLLYEAGRRAGGVRGRRTWQLTTGLFAGLSLALTARMATTPEPLPQVVVVHEKASPGASATEPDAPARDTQSTLAGASGSVAD